MIVYIRLGTIVLFVIASGVIIYLTLANRNLKKLYRDIKAKNRTLGEEKQECEKLYVAALEDARSLRTQLDKNYLYIQYMYDRFTKGEVNSTDRGTAKVSTTIEEDRNLQAMTWPGQSYQSSLLEEDPNLETMPWAGQPEQSSLVDDVTIKIDTNVSNPTSSFVVQRNIDSARDRREEVLRRNNPPTVIRFDLSPGAPRE